MNDEVNEKLLNNDELARLHSMQKAAEGKASAREWAEVFGPATAAEEIRRRPATTVAWVIYLVAGLLAVSWMVGSRDSGGGTVMLLLCALLGGAALAAIAVQEGREWAQKQIPVYLDSIGYHGRTESEPDRSDGPTYKSASQLRKEWYNEGGPHPELTRRDYDLIQGVFGMSADEWEANKPD